MNTALSAAAEFGPYFALHGGPGVVSLSREQLYEPRLLDKLLGEVGEEIGTDESRVAASTLQYGFAARCWSLVLGAWQCGGVVIDLRRLNYVLAGSGSIELSMADVRAWDCSSLAANEAAELIADTVIAGQLTDFHTALRTVSRLAEGMLWGNAASSLSALAANPSAMRPSDQLTGMAAEILSRAPLADRLATTAVGTVQRRSCCLWYRTRDRDNCADCPLAGRPVMQQ